MPTLNQPESFVQWTGELVTAGGEVGQGSRDFLDGWMEAFVALVEAHSGKI
jgi:chromate reductase